MVYQQILFRSTGSYEPDLELESGLHSDGKFRSTGSYEPDPFQCVYISMGPSFDPQALTSLTLKAVKEQYDTEVSIHRLLRA